MDGNSKACPSTRASDAIYNFANSGIRKKPDTSLKPAYYCRFLESCRYSTAASTTWTHGLQSCSCAYGVRPAVAIGLGSWLPLPTGLCTRATRQTMKTMETLVAWPQSQLLGVDLILD